MRGKISPLVWWIILGGLILTSGGYTAVKVWGKTRGLRNNNPGNIRHSSAKWQGMATTQTDTSFIQFVSPEYGIRALYKILQTYRANGYTTIRQIINRWAPPSENDTGAYINAVVKHVGKPADVPVDLNSSEGVKLVEAIIKHENGVNPYPESLVTKGISLA
jgi:hypothetical protein